MPTTTTSSTTTTTAPPVFVPTTTTVPTTLPPQASWSGTWSGVLYQVDASPCDVNLFAQFGVSFSVVQTGQTVTVTSGGTATLNDDGSLTVSTVSTFPVGCSRSIDIVATLDGGAHAYMVQQCPSHMTPVGLYPGYSCDASYTGTIRR